MIKLIKKYNNLSFEEKTAYSALFSLVSNTILSIFKFILAIFKGVFFAVSGVINVVTIGSKLMCYRGMREGEYHNLKKRNTLTAIFVILMGIQYGIYMGRLLYSDVGTMAYSKGLAIAIACVSFVEFGIAVRGLFKTYGMGHYYRNVKLINLCSALTAIVLTEVALTSFFGEGDNRTMNGIFGLVVAILIVLIGIYILIIPLFSLIGKEEQIYQGNKDIEEIHIQITKSQVYGNYYYQGINDQGVIKGEIYQGKSPIRKWNIMIKIICIVLSEILIFPYMLGALINSFKGNYLIKKLNKEMEKQGFYNINN